MIICGHPGCGRSARRNPDLWSSNRFDSHCSLHDGAGDHGDICYCQPPAPIANGECGICRHLILAFAHPDIATCTSGPAPARPGAHIGVTGSQSDPPVSHTTGAQPDSPATPPTRT